MTEMTPKEKRIHTALRELIDEAGGCEEAGRLLRTSWSPDGLKKAQVGRMNVDPPEAFLNIFQMSKLEAAVGRPIITQAMAAMSGFDLVPRVDPVCKPSCIHAAIGLVMGEATDLARTYAELAPDGLSPTDGELIERELRDAAKAIEHARQACAAIQAKRKA